MPRVKKFTSFPRPDGCSDLKMDLVGRVFKIAKGTPCAYDLVNVDDSGLKVRAETKCTGTKANPCDHIVTADQSKFHNVWRITRILASLMKDEGAFEKEANQRMKREQFVEIFKSVTSRYYPEKSSVWKVKKILAEREPSQLYINTHEKPWAASESVKEEMAMERKRDPQIDDAAKEVRTVLGWNPDSEEEKLKYWKGEIRTATDGLRAAFKIKENFTHVTYDPPLPMPKPGEPEAKKRLILKIN